MSDDLIALGRYGASSALVTREGEVVSQARNILLLFRPAWADHRLLARPDVKIFDLAELWAVVRPGQNAAPTLRSMMEVTVNSPEESAYYLYELKDRLIEEACAQMDRIGSYLLWLAAQNQAYRWPWLDELLSHASGEPLYDVTELLRSVAKWSVSPGWPAQETTGAPTFRPDQALYYNALTDFFGSDHAPETLIAVGGTGVGKTRAYLAAARGRGQVWVSTFTRALQKQVQNEAMRHLGWPAHIRKGRDNYLCLRLAAEAWERAPHWADGRQHVALMAVLRWLEATQDGDMTGGSFPGWMVSLFGPQATTDLTDWRRECSYNACPYFQNCFAERARAWSEDAPLVIANHAVTASLVQRGGRLPHTLIMDEAHHVEHVADDALTAGISVVSATDVGRFLLGVAGDGRRRGRRGFLETLAETLPETDGRLIRETARLAVDLLPVSHALDRLRGGNPTGLLELWLRHIWERAEKAAENNTAYDWDLDRGEVPPPPPALVNAVTQLLDALSAILYRMEHYDREATLELGQRVYDPKRDALLGVLLPVRLWLTQWQQLGQGLDETHMEWASVRREENAVKDVGLFRAWREPLPVWQTLVNQVTDSTVYTTATPTKALLSLSDVQSVAVESPFDYSVQSRVLILTDVDINHDHKVAEAMGSLFAVSGGGAMGVFTAIARLRRVHDLLEPLMEDADMRLLAQHVDPMDVATLIDLFRNEPRCAMLGTDAVRDGVDIPGEALRLLAFDRVPWPRPDLLHKARRDHVGGRTYDEDLVRLKLRQGFGRLIRTETDRGVFVMLDSRLPSRLYDAFPDGVPIERVSLAEALEKLAHFFENGVGSLAA